MGAPSITITRPAAAAGQPGFVVDYANDHILMGALALTTTDGSLPVA